MTLPDLPSGLDALPVLIPIVGQDREGATLAAVLLSQLEVPDEGVGLESHEVDHLLTSLEPDYAPSVRRAVAVTLGRFREWQAVPLLCRLAGSDADSQLRSAAAGALGAIGDTRAVGALTDAVVHDVDAEVRTAAADALADLAALASAAVVRQATQDDNAEVRQSAVAALAELATPAAASGLARISREDQDDDVRALAHALASLIPRTLPVPPGPGSSQDAVTALGELLDELGTIGTGTIAAEVHRHGVGLWLYTERYRRGDVLVVTVLGDDGEPIELPNIGLLMEVVPYPEDPVVNAQILTRPAGFDQHGHARVTIPPTTALMRLRLRVPKLAPAMSEGGDPGDGGRPRPNSEVAAATALPDPPPIEILGRATRLWLEVVPLEGTVAAVESERREHAGTLLRLPAQVAGPAGTVPLWTPLRWSEVQGVCRAEVGVQPNEIDDRASLPDPSPPSHLGAHDEDALRISVSRAREWTRAAWRELADGPSVSAEVRAILDDALSSDLAP